MNYEHFLYYNLLLEHSKLSEGIPYDMLYPQLLESYDVFEASIHNDADMSEYDAMVEFILSDTFSLSSAVTLTMPADVEDVACEWVQLLQDRDDAYNLEDYDRAEDIEREQRDKAEYLVGCILGGRS